MKGHHPLAQAPSAVRRGHALDFCQWIGAALPCAPLAREPNKGVREIISQTNLKIASEAVKQNTNPRGDKRKPAIAISLECSRLVSGGGT